MDIFFPLLLVYHNYTKGMVSEIVFGATFGLLWLKPYLGGISDRFGYRPSILLSLTGIALLYMLIPLISGLINMIVYYFLVYLLIYIGYPSVNNGIATKAPAKQIGLAFGAFGVYTSFGRTSSTFIMGPIMEKLKIDDTFILSGFFLLLFVILLFFMSKENRPYNQLQNSNF